MGQVYDVEGYTPDRSPESAGVPQGGDPGQAGDAGDRGPTGARLKVALLGYSDPPDFNILIQDILLRKSPYDSGVTEIMYAVSGEALPISTTQAKSGLLQV